MGAPILSPVAGAGQAGRLYGNPHFDYLSGMLPRDIKQLFAWCELVYMSMPHIANGIRFERVYCRQGIEHRLTKPNHPGTNGQVKRMNRTLKEATVNGYYYQTHAHLEEPMSTFVDVHNFAKQRKTLQGLTPCE